MHEHLLRHIWAKQLFDRSRLSASDGRPVTIISGGEVNRGSGPDFFRAAVTIGGTTYAGDIEFHRTADDWYLHGHHRDPRYNTVILHVVLNGSGRETRSESGRIVPTAAIGPLLTAPLSSIEQQLSREEFDSRSGTIPCVPYNERVPVPVIADWLQRMYRERLQRKVERLYDRLCHICSTHQRSIAETPAVYGDPADDLPLPETGIDRFLLMRSTGWEQLLYEEMMDGLGYSNNRLPMKAVAEIVAIPRLRLFDNFSKREEPYELTVTVLESILFKTSGLLPSVNDVRDQDAKVYLHSLTAAWSELPAKISVSPLHSSAWNFSPTRPANFPTIRLAAAAVLLHRILYRSMFRSIITIVHGPFASPRSKVEQFSGLFDCGDHWYWGFRYSFFDERSPRHQLLGRTRSLEIMTNTVIPFVCLYATVFGKRDLFERSVEVAAAIPPLEANAVLRKMEKQLIQQRFTVTSALTQQGLIQLYRLYCSAGRCGECAVGTSTER